jgi:hypothetical protein
MVATLAAAALSAASFNCFCCVSFKAMSSPLLKIFARP